MIEPYLEANDREERLLAPYAMRSRDSRGREHEEDPSDLRTAFRMAGKVLDLSNQSVSEAMVPLEDRRTCLASGTMSSDRVSVSFITVKKPSSSSRSFSAAYNFS